MSVAIRINSQYCIHINIWIGFTFKRITWMVWKFIIFPSQWHFCFNGYMHIINPCSQLSKVDHSGNTSKNKQKIQNKIRGSDRMSQEQIQYKKKENRKKTQKIKNRQIYKHTFFFLLFLIIIQKLSKNGIMYSIFFIIFYFFLCRRRQCQNN